MAQLLISLSLPAITGVLLDSICGVASACFIAALNSRTVNNINVICTVRSLVRTIKFNITVKMNDVISVGLNRGRGRGTGHFTSDNVLVKLILNFLVTIVYLLFLGPVLEVVNTARAVLPCTHSCTVVVLVTTPLVYASCMANPLLHTRNETACSVLINITNKLVGVTLSPLFVFAFGLKIGNTTVTATLDRIVDFSLTVKFCILNGNIVGLSFGCMDRSVGSC